MNCFGNTLVMEDDIKLEFWWLVQTVTETAKVEYGADVHSTMQGMWEDIASLCVVFHALLLVVVCQPWKCTHLTHTRRTLGT